MRSDARKRRYINKAIEEYEYSWAPEYEKRAMTKRAVSAGTVDIDPNAIDKVEVAPNGAWVAAQVWVPKEWLGRRRAPKTRKAKS